MRGSVSRALIAGVTITSVLATACTAARPWPAQPVALAARTFGGPAEIRTIDVLPLDLQLWAEPGAEIDLGRVRETSELALMNTAIEGLVTRDYGVGAMMDWSGAYAGGVAMDKDDVIGTVRSLARYGALVGERTDQLPTPYLPARLGSATGADATLYVGGWAYVAGEHSSTGEKIAEGIVTGLLILSVVVVIAMLIGDHKSSGHGGSSRIAGAGRGGRPTFNPSRGAGHALGGLHRGSRFAHHGPSTTTKMMNAVARTAVDLAVTAPNWVDDPSVTRSGGDPAMYLEMTLVDNHTGSALWHAHQLFPANAASAKDAARAARTMLASLPARIVQAGAQ